MKGMSVIDWIAIILLIVGGLAWGLLGVFSFDLVGTVFGSWSWVVTTIYGLVGLSAIWAIISLARN